MPDPDAQIPTPDELLRPGIDRLVTLRPRALAQINGGRGVYSHIFAGWRAQAALMVRRMADYAKNGRLPFADDAPLSELVGSEFDTLADLDATTAIGSATLTRDAGRPGGTIRKGSRFSRPADATSRNLYAAASYVSSVDTFVPQGAMSVEVALEASRTGAFANLPSMGFGQTELEIADNIFDRTAWTVSTYEMAGGSDGVTDDDVKQYARAFSQGQYAPTARAAVAGAFRAGVKHAIAFDDVATASLHLYVADASWAGSSRWAKYIRQSLSDGKFVGFGCKVVVTSATSVIVSVEATCKVRRQEYLADTSSIDVAIQKAIRAYFDDRPNWNRWTTSALRGVIARADRRLLSCSSAVIKTTAGSVVLDPLFPQAVHLMLVDNGVGVTYASPT